VGAGGNQPAALAPGLWGAGAVAWTRTKKQIPPGPRPHGRRSGFSGGFRWGRGAKIGKNPGGRWGPQNLQIVRPVGGLTGGGVRLEGDPNIGGKGWRGEQGGATGRLSMLPWDGRGGTNWGSPGPGMGASCVLGEWGPPWFRGFRWGYFRTGGHFLGGARCTRGPPPPGAPFSSPAKLTTL